MSGNTRLFSAQQSGVIGDMGVGVSNVTTFQMNANKTADGTITEWNNPASPDDGAGSVGHKMVTVSGGVFTIPTLGTWLIIGKFHGQKVGDDNWLSVALIRDSDGLTQDEGVFGIGNASSSGIGAQAGGLIIAYCTAVATDSSRTYRFAAGSVGSGSYISGSNWWTTSASASHATFIKLGNTIAET